METFHMLMTLSMHPDQSPQPAARTRTTDSRIEIDAGDQCRNIDLDDDSPSPPASTPPKPVVDATRPRERMAQRRCGGM